MSEEKKKTTDGAKLEDSNIANYGSKMHKDAKLAAAKTEKAWEGCGAAVGIEVWRIEKFQVKRWPTDQYGTFYSGDSYIVLNTYQPDPESDKLAYNVHFWLGEKTTQDEMGTAAYKTVELDDLLGDLPVQYREVQGFESSQFMSCFGKISILDGGVDSGFKSVKPDEYKPRLLHFKGKSEKSVRVSQRPLAVSSLNDGDVFLLDNGLQLIQWNGTSAGIFEKRTAMKVIAGLKEERNGRPKSEILDGDEAHDTFWSILGCTDGKIVIPDAIPDKKVGKQTKRLFKLSDSSGSVVMTEVASGDGNILKSKLASDDVMILDVGIVIYVWIGKGASKAERSQGISYATNYLTKNNLPMHTPISRVIEGKESKAFHGEFDG
jgi:gelsolin